MCSGGCKRTASFMMQRPISEGVRNIELHEPFHERRCKNNSIKLTNRNLPSFLSSHSILEAPLISTDIN